VKQLHGSPLFFTALSVTGIVCFVMFSISRMKWPGYEYLGEYTWKRYNIERTEQLKKHFTAKSDYTDIGVLNICYTSVEPFRLYSARDDSSAFGVITELSYDVESFDGMYTHCELRFEPSELEALFRPLYFVYANHSWGFRVLSIDDDWIEIVYDEANSLVCYIKNRKWSMHYDYPVEATVERSLAEEDLVSWQEWFTGVRKKDVVDGHTLSSRYVDGAWIVFADSLPLYDRIDGDILLPVESADTHFRADSVRGEWMRLEEYPSDWWRRPENHRHVWVRWREGKTILISYSKLFPIE
jgi:hypothetical protein